MIETIVRPYRLEDREAWNELNASAVNGHFMFDRNFMEYHAERFKDASLMVEENGSPVAILPANRSNEIVYSHQGLTFGGLVLLDPSATATMRQMDAIADHFASQGLLVMIYKALPMIYHTVPACADLYWLYRQEGKLVRRDVTTTIDYRTQTAYSSRRRRGVKKASSANLSFRQSLDFGGFWQLLASVLQIRHGVVPVHTREELRLLAGRFPDQIRLFTATLEGEIVAGVLVFVHTLVAHAQYIAVNERGRSLGALDGLLDTLIRQFADQKRYFDFGISTEEAGQYLNTGLVTQKEEFGGSSILHDIYEVKLERLSQPGGKRGPG